MGHLARIVLGSLSVVLGSLSVAACGDDPPFQPLGTLCSDLTEDICDARAGGCCPGVDEMDCVRVERARCESELETLAGERLHYDAREAAVIRRAARPQLDNCEAPPVLASFFTGGLVEGAPCERDAQCSGGLCITETRVCAAALTTLCSMP